jgi:agmatine deiminase
LTREEIEEGLRSYLGVDVVIWLPHGLVEDRDTDGHIDGLAQYLRPGAVMLAIAAGSDDPNAARSTRTGRRCRRRRMRGVAPWRCSTVR